MTGKKYVTHVPCECNYTLHKLIYIVFKYIILFVIFEVSYQICCCSRLFKFLASQTS